MGDNHKRCASVSQSMFHGPLHQLHCRTGKNTDFQAHFELIGKNLEIFILNMLPG